MFFTQSGRCYVEKVYEIPEMSRSSKGRSIANINHGAPPREENCCDHHASSPKVTGTGPNAVDNTWDENLHVIFSAQSGIVKKSNLSDFKNIRKGGIIAAQIEEGDKLIDAKLTTGQNEEILLITKDGMEHPLQ